jgi:hypothetical protein
MKKNITPKFEVQKFASCEAMESRVVDILKRYQDRYWYPYPMLYARDGIVPMSIDSSARLEKSVASPAPTASSLDSISS